MKPKHGESLDGLEEKTQPLPYNPWFIQLWVPPLLKIENC